MLIVVLSDGLFNKGLKYSEFLAQDEIEALHFTYDYTKVPVYSLLKSYLEQTHHWMYDGNGRWSTSNMMIRLRSNGDKLRLEVWQIDGDVKRIHELDIEDTDMVISRLRKLINI